MDKDKVVRGLTGLALQRGYLDELNIEHYGPADGPCIVVDEEANEVSIFLGKQPMAVVTADFESATMKQLMCELQRLHAQFSVSTDGTVTCCIGQAVAVGDSYAIAGMRACILAGQSS